MPNQNDRMFQDLKETQQKLKDAVALINLNVTRLRRWTNPNSFLGQDLQELANENSFFLAQHPVEQNEYIDWAIKATQNIANVTSSGGANVITVDKEAMSEIPEGIPILTEEDVKSALQSSADGANELNENLKSTFTLSSDSAKIRLD